MMVGRLSNEGIKKKKEKMWDVKHAWYKLVSQCLRTYVGTASGSAAG